MAYSNVEVRKFEGLYLQANSFDVPDGAMEIAENVVLRSDAVISKTRGFYTFWENSDGPLTDVRGLTNYEDHLIGVFADGMGYFTTTPIASPQPEVRGVLTQNGTLEPATNRPARFAQQNLNLYATYFDGLFKLEAFNTPLMQAGVAPGITLRHTVGSGNGGPLPANSRTAYRVVFGRRDANGNLNLGAPSDVLTIGVGPDFTSGGVDPTGPVPYTSSGAGPYTVTVTTPEPHLLTVGDQIAVSAGTDADANGTQTVTATPSALTFQFSVVADPLTGTLDYTMSRTATIEIDIPGDMPAGDGFFVRISRGPPSVGVDTVPENNFRLAGELELTALNIASRVIFFTDDVDEMFLGEELYTNENSREGILQSNYRPPMAEDIVLHKEFMFYGDILTRQILLLDFMAYAATTNFFSAVISIGATTKEAFRPVSGVGNLLTTATSVAGTTTIVITSAAHGFGTGWTAFVTNITGTLTEGTYPVTLVDANNFSILVTVGQTATALDFEGVKNNLNQAVFYGDSNSGSVAFDIEMTAQHFMKAINKTSSQMYGNYVSPSSSEPGKLQISSVGFPTSLISIASTVPDLFIQPVPLSFIAGRQIFAELDDFPDGIAYSKFQEPEAVPIINRIRVGIRNKRVLRIFSLGDALIIVKEDGIFKLVGNAPENFSIVDIDTTMHGDGSGANCADKINNTVIARTNQGIAEITENGARIISRRIDDIVQPLHRLGNGAACVFAYETDRICYGSSVVLNSPAHGNQKALMYNVVNQTWTDTTQHFHLAAVGPSDCMYIARGPTTAEFATIFRQRKANNLLDYCNEFLSGTITVAPGRLTGTFTLVGGSLVSAPEDGCTLFYNDRLTRVSTVVSIDATNFTLVFDRQTNVPVGVLTVVYIYQPIRSRIKFAPMHAGNTGLMKNFGQFQVHLRQQQISEMRLTFAGDYYGSSQGVVWEQINFTLDDPGYGLEPWGLFAWGQSPSANLYAGTRPANIIRTYVPTYAARNTFIQPILVHNVAAEAMFIQAISWNMQAYGERVSK